MAGNSVNKYWGDRLFQDSKPTGLFSIIPFVCLCFLILLLSECKCKRGVLFSGWVVNQQGQAIAEALVKVNDDFIHTVTTSNYNFLSRKLMC